MCDYPIAAPGSPGSLSPKQSVNGIPAMADMTEEELQHLYENFETTWLLSAVDKLDEVRAMLADGEDLETPELRTSLLKLHGLAMAVVNDGVASKAEDFFELAQDIELEVSDMIEALQSIQRVLLKLGELYPDSLAED